MSRAALVEFARRCAAAGLNHGATGNLSVRTGAGLLITPSGVEPVALGEASMVELDGAGNPLGPGRPSSEWRMHAAIYAARRDVDAIVHTHPPFATTVACLRQDLPAVHYMIAISGSDRVRCSRYETFGTPGLSEAALEALGSSRACLLANHGLVAAGPDLATAYRVTEAVERVAEYWWRAKAVGEPVVLTDAEMVAALERFRGY